MDGSTCKGSFKLVHQLAGHTHGSHEEPDVRQSGRWDRGIAQTSWVFLPRCCTYGNRRMEAPAHAEMNV